MENKDKSITLDDIAALAQVSPATVSRFFSNPDIVAEKTADRIRQAVIKTGYIPNKLAGGLASNKSRLVSILIPQLSPSIFNEPVETMVNTLSNSGRVVVLGITEFDIQRADQLVMNALGHRAEAIILMVAISDEVRTFLKNSKTSIIEIWGLPEDPIDVCVGFSHIEIGKHLARFLHSRGYIRPHFISSEGSRSKERYEGFVAEWQTLSGAQDVSHNCLPVPLAYGNARSSFAAIKRLPVLPDVIVCGSDWLAQGLITEAQAAGYKVPDDIAVVGFGNSSQCGETRPTITSVEMDSVKLAQNVLGVLNARDRRETINESSIDIGFKIVARESA